MDAEVTPDDITNLSTASTSSGAGEDYVETSAGDLATVGGLDNVQAALTRRMASDGLPWDDTYGAKPRRYIDGTPGALPALRGHARQPGAGRRPGQDRERHARHADPTDSQYDVSVTLVGDDQPLSVPGPGTP